jgi:hypothetical protein
MNDIMNRNSTPPLVPIPAFDKDGYLPVGVHAATLAEVQERFGGGDKGEQFKQLAALYRTSCEAGIDRMVLAGSFVTQKGACRDLDGILFGPETANWDPVVRHVSPPGKGLDFFIATDAPMLRALVELFSRRTEGGRRGLIEIPVTGGVAVSGVPVNPTTYETVLDYQLGKFRKLHKEAHTEIERQALAGLIGEFERKKTIGACDRGLATRAKR